jgi:hypothetical protein
MCTKLLLPLHDVLGAITMLRGNDPLTLSNAVEYRIRVEGAVDSRQLASVLGLFSIVPPSPGSPHPITTITGLVSNQAHLNALLNYLHGLGLPLVSVDALRVIDSAHV